MAHSYLHTKKFERIYKDYYQRLYFQAMNITGDTEASKDIVEDVFMRLWSNIGKVDESKIDSYLNISISHGAIDHLRREVRVRTHNREYSRLALGNSTDDAEEVEREMLVYKMLSLFNSPTRTILELRYIGGLKYEEIAVVRGISINAVKKHLMKALKKLRELYKAKGILKKC